MSPRDPAQLRQASVKPNETSAKRKVPPGAHPNTWDRLESQIDYYDSESISAKHWYRRLKWVEIGFAAAIPLLAGFVPPLFAGAAGAIVVVLEALQALGQYHQHWTTYRSTCEALRHEKYLFLATAGPYVSSDHPGELLAERVEALVSQEHAQWIASRDRSTKLLEHPRAAP